MAQLPVNARLIYTTPSHPIPLGTPMSLAPTGHADAPGALDWTTSHDAVIVADDLDASAIAYLP
jgi:DNA-binding transcriptional MocR family regulator